MADRMTHDELDALSTTQLKSRVERLFNLQMNSTTTEDVRKTLDDAINAAKATLEKKELYTIMLNAQRGCRVALAKTYFNMTAQQLIDAYDHHVSEQRKLFLAYVGQVDEKRRALGQEPDGRVLDGRAVEPGDLDAKLEKQGLPTLVDIMQSIDSIPIEDTKEYDRWTTLRKKLQELGDELGYSLL